VPVAAGVHGQYACGVARMFQLLNHRRPWRGHRCGSSSWGWAALLVEAAHAVAAVLNHLADAHAGVFEGAESERNLAQDFPGLARERVFVALAVELDLVLERAEAHLQVFAGRADAVAFIGQRGRRGDVVRVGLRVRVHVLSPLFVGAVAENVVGGFSTSLRLRAAGGVVQVGVVGVLPSPVDLNVLVPVAAHGLVQVRVGQVRAGQVRAGQVRAGQVRAGQVRVGQVRVGQVRVGQVRVGQVRAGQVRAGQVRAGQVRAGQVRAGRDRLFHREAQLEAIGLFGDLGGEFAGEHHFAGETVFDFEFHTDSGSGVVSAVGALT